MQRSESCHLLAAGEFCDGFGAFADSVLGQLSRQEETDGCLDFPRCDGRLLVVEGEARSFSCDPFEDVIDEGVHDVHCLAGNASVGMHLFEHLVDVDGVAFTSFLVAL